jgi:hypothetical protein
VYAKQGNLRRRPALTSVGPSTTPGTASNVRLIVEHQHGDSAPTETLRPTADGNDNNWTPSSGSDNYAMVDETSADGDTTYNTAPTGSDDDDMYAFGNISGLTTIDKITFHITAKLVDDGGGADFQNCSVRYYDVSATTTYTVGTTNNWRFSDGYLEKTIESTTNPRDSNPWVVADVNADEFGVRANSDTNESFRVTQFYMVLEGSGAAGRELSKIVISENEFLRLEEDLASFTDIDDTLASTASATQVWDTCEFDNKIWFTNDTDDFFNYPDASDLLDQNTTALEAKTIAPFGDRLFAGNIEESSTRLRSRIRWSVVGDGDDFAGAGSGNFDLDARPGEIVKILQMAEKANTFVGVLVAYKDTSIYHIYATGEASDPFDYRLMDGSVGAVSTAGVDSYVNQEGREVHAFIGKRNGELNIFEWNGNQTIPIGDPIKDDMNANIAWGSAGLSLVRFDPATSLLWCGIPRTNETFPTTFYVYDIVRRTWKEHDFNDTITALGQYKISSQPTLMAGKTDGLLFRSNTSTTADSGEDSQTLIETGDFWLNSPTGQAIVYRVWLWYIDRGATTVAIDISVNGGQTYGTATSKSIGGGTSGALSLSKYDFVQHGRSFRFRLTDTVDDDLEIVRLVVEWEPQDVIPVVHSLQTDG